MMKPKFGALGIGLILALVVTILLIALPKSANLYTAYAFCLVGITIIVAGVWANDENAPASYALLGQIYWFLPVSLFLSIIVLALQGIGIFTLPTLWHCVLQVILLAVVGIRVVAVYTGKKYIDEVEKQVSNRRNTIKDQ